MLAKHFVECFPSAMSDRLDVFIWVGGHETMYTAISASSPVLVEGRGTRKAMAEHMGRFWRSNMNFVE